MAFGECSLCIWDSKTRVNFAIILMICQCFFMGIGIGSLSTVALIFYKFLAFRLAGLDFVNWKIVWLMFSVGVIYTTIHFFIFVICLSVTDWRMFYRGQLCFQTITFFVVFFVIYFLIVILVAGAMVKSYKLTLQTVIYIFIKLLGFF
ncbi:hypothetical protein HELRODRAFT_159046 [Helobdella robusta]|uniref:Uncharacterized protein n=1 Tax=Helobdella robusta TaxID=6412 RepID=T1ENI7_HELRO|nr:hypothetical protein HELRODRAFT_159046 [Helobdella robusta]ESO12498.1 hypothetical protein HELRODRAFT_159046 [Helobdella robusta]